MRWRVYFKPFLDNGTYASAYTEVTTDVVALGNPQQTIDNNDYNVGVIRNSGFQITLRNDHGHYSDVDTLQSIFRYTRRNVKVKITWDVRDYDLICGFFTCDTEPLGGEYVVFEGLINDVTTVSNIVAQQAIFSILGYESLLDSIDMPYASISAGQTFSQLIQAGIDQTPFNTFVTVAGSNITPGTDLASDNVSAYENKTVGSILKNLLLAANSVLFIKNNTVYVTDRTASATSDFTFHGQATNSGNENIINIPKYRDGMARVFNWWTWTDNTYRSRDTTSVDKYGIRAKEIHLEIINDASTSKIQTILDANKTEFAFPKIELDLETPIWYDVLALNILDRVNIDYPTIYIPYDAGDLPRYGFVTYDGTARYPYEQWALTIDVSTSFKIMSKKIDTKKQTITFGLREI